MFEHWNYPGENPMQDPIGLHRILSGSCLLQDPMKITANNFW